MTTGDLPENPEEAPPVALPIDGVLDLHTFAPRQVQAVVADYLDACQAAGIREVRVVHGKGIGEQRRAVHAVLSRHPTVLRFALATPAFGGWGATIVHLRAPEPEGEAGASSDGRSR